MGKRKLDENDAPTVEIPSGKDEGSKPELSSFASFNLDHRLLQAIEKFEFAEPTPVQSRAIPLAIEGKSLLAKSRTGSGKTAAYVLPTIHSLLRRKETNSKEKIIFALVLVPTRELADQVTRSFASFAEFCSKEVRVMNLSQRVSDAVLNAKLRDVPDVVVSTPGRVGQLINDGSLDLADVQRFVIDEAEDVLSLGYEEDIKLISKTLSRGVQSFLLSATLTPEVEQLASAFCHEPIIINIAETEEDKHSLTQYVVTCGEEEKFLLIYVIFKLKLLQGKTIVFVADTDRCYRLRLYLEQFGLRSCVLNSELPVNSRLHVIEEFNKGVFDILIAADDQEVIGGVHRKPKAATAGVMAEDEAGLTDEDMDETLEKQPKEAKGYQKDYGISRGIDFQNVSCVLNFDLPRTSKSYTHRIGRTARAGRTGTALSFVVPCSEHNKHKYTTIPQSKHDERILEKIVARQSKKGNQLTPYQFDTKQVEAFRYRMNDALRAVTRVAVREARAREIKQELVKSEKLRKHFEENPEDLRHLRASGSEGGVVRVQSHMKHVPDYLMPGGARKDVKDVGFVGLNGDERNKRRKKNGSVKKGGFKKKGSGRKNDPLKSFTTRRK